MRGVNYQVTVRVSPTFQTTPCVGYVTGGEATSKGPRTTNGVAFTRQETYARARRAAEEKETMFSKPRSVVLREKGGDWGGEVAEVLEVEPTRPTSGFIPLGLIPPRLSSRVTVRSSSIMSSQQGRKNNPRRIYHWVRGRLVLS